MQRNYNFIYQKLVKDESDVVGQIAYSLYKQQKIQYIEDFKKENRGVSPTDVELTTFNSFSSLDHSLETYRIKAEILLKSFLDNVLQETFDDMEEEVKKNQSQLLEEIIEPIKPPNKWMSFFGGVMQNILATGAVAIIFAITLIILQVKDKGTKEVIEHTFDVQITPTVKSTAITKDSTIKDTLNKKPK